MPPTVSIVAVESLHGHRLKMTFDDGTTQVVDFAPFLSKALHPAVHKWLDSSLFQSYRLEHGDLVWGDWELCFPIADLYHGSIG